MSTAIKTLGRRCRACRTQSTSPLTPASSSHTRAFFSLPFLRPKSQPEADAAEPAIPEEDVHVPQPPALKRLIAQDPYRRIRFEPALGSGQGPVNVLKQLNARDKTRRWVEIESHMVPFWSVTCSGEFAARFTSTEGYGPMHGPNAPFNLGFMISAVGPEHWCNNFIYLEDTAREIGMSVLLQKSYSGQGPCRDGMIDVRGAQPILGPTYPFESVPLFKLSYPKMSSNAIRQIVEPKLLSLLFDWSSSATLDNKVAEGLSFPITRCHALPIYRVVHKFTDSTGAIAIAEGSFSNDPIISQPLYSFAHPEGTGRWSHVFMREHQYFLTVADLAGTKADISVTETPDDLLRVRNIILDTPRNPTHWEDRYILPADAGSGHDAKALIDFLASRTDSRNPEQSAPLYPVVKPRPARPAPKKEAPAPEVAPPRAPPRARAQRPPARKPDPIKGKTTASSLRRLLGRASEQPKSQTASNTSGSGLGDFAASNPPAPTPKTTSVPVADPKGAYKILGIKADETFLDAAQAPLIDKLLAEARRQQQVKYHPDGGHEDDEISKRINIAFDTLRTVESRRQYNERKI